MRSISSLGISVLLSALLLGSAGAQLRLSDQQAQSVIPVFDSRTHEALKCWVERWNPSLDFAFRFVTGYVANCPLNQFGGKEVVLSTYVRITPQDKPPLLFGTSDHIPALASDMRGAFGPGMRNLKTEISVSGALAIGEGRYLVELVVKDSLNRTYRKRWRLHAVIHRSERGVAIAIKPLSVESIEQASWQTASEKAGRLRLSILLNAAPFNRYQYSLRAWDRAFLLQTIYTVLRQTPHSSVHLVAFNLDQQRELFRSDQFDNSAFSGLAGALEKLELSTVSLNALKKRDSPEFLVALADRELATDRADAIIFLGPNTRMDTEISQGALTKKRKDSPPLFYFEYFPWVGYDFPDSIDWLVKSAGGRVYLVHTPAQLDQSIDKMLAQLKQQ